MAAIARNLLWFKEKLLFGSPIVEQHLNVISIQN